MLFSGGLEVRFNLSTPGIREEGVFATEHSGYCSKIVNSTLGGMLEVKSECEVNGSGVGTS